MLRDVEYLDGDNPALLVEAEQDASVDFFSLDYAMSE